MVSSSTNSWQVLSMKYNRHRFAIAALATLNVVALPTTVLGGLVVDRGLPDSSNRNVWPAATPPAAADRSNWLAGATDPEFFGDDFTLPTPSGVNEYWRIDTIRMWVVGDDVANATTFGQLFPNVSLFLTDGTGPLAGTESLSRQAFANVTGNSTDNANVVITPIQYTSPAEDYLDPVDGTAQQLFEIEFKNLNLYYPVGAGPQVGFGLYAVETPDWTPTMHGTVASLAGTTQDGSNDKVHIFEILSPTSAQFSSLGGFDLLLDDDLGFGTPNFDINVQVEATLVPETTTYVGWGVMAMVLAGGMYLRRRGSRA